MTISTKEDAAQVCYGWQECQVCGLVGPDVHLRPVVRYQGGGGMVWTNQCEDVAACWQRREAKQKEARA